MQGYVQKYGIWFPDSYPDALIELKCWKHWREPEYQSSELKDPWECFWRGIYQILPRNEFVRHRWAEEHVYDWTTEKFVITWGCASSGKSNDYGLLALVDWSVDPDKTVTILASTTVPMLKLRSYESVMRYFKKLQRHSPFKMPGKIRKTDSAIILDDEDDSVDVTDKASIRGVAVAEGTEEEARAKLQGAHLPFVRLILDELSQMRSAAMAVRTNLAIGAIDFKLIGMCNIDSFMDLAGQHSIPVKEGGYGALDPNVDEEWRSQYGKVRRHDGLRSPAIMEPDRKDLSFLLTKPVLDEIIAQAGGNLDDKQIWTMVRAWPPGQGKTQTLLSMAEILQYRAMEPVTWRGAPAVKVVGVDPAFSEDGNQGVVQFMEIGYDINGELRIHFPPAVFLKIDASSKIPVLQQVGEQVIRACVDFLAPGLRFDTRSAALTSLGDLIGVDDAATQSLADHLMIQYGVPVRRFSANKAASELKLSTTDPMKAEDRFWDQGTELWAATAAFVRAGQIRGLPPRAAQQLTSRPTEPNKRPLRLVSKRSKKAEGGTGKDSPDDMDACGFGIGVVRFFLKILAGQTRLPEKFATATDVGGSFHDGAWRRAALRHDLDAKAYAHQP